MDEQEAGRGGRWVQKEDLERKNVSKRRTPVREGVGGWTQGLQGEQFSREPSAPGAAGLQPDGQAAVIALSVRWPGVELACLNPETYGERGHNPVRFVFTEERWKSQRRSGRDRCEDGAEWTGAGGGDKEGS